MYYGVGYEEVDTDEAIDLILTLPRGSLYIAKKYPEYAWSEARELTADIQDTLVALVYATHGQKDAPKIVRPSDVVARKKAMARAKTAKQKIETLEWEQVDE